RRHSESHGGITSRFSSRKELRNPVETGRQRIHPVLKINPNGGCFGGTGSAIFLQNLVPINIRRAGLVLTGSNVCEMKPLLIEAEIAAVSGLADAAATMELGHGKPCQRTGENLVFFSVSDHSVDRKETTADRLLERLLSFVWGKRPESKAEL